MHLRILSLCGAVMLLALSPAQAIQLKNAPKGMQIYRGFAMPRQTPRATKFRRTKRTVSFNSPLPPGSIVVRTGERRLYFVLGEGKALRYDIGVGREGFAWSGRNRISRKREWPEWTPPAAMLIREEKRGLTLPRLMPGGEGNPLGARALYLGSTEYRIHGTAEPWTIGKAISSGCIRMHNEEVIDLYDRVKVGALVVVE